MYVYNCINDGNNEAHIPLLSFISFTRPWNYEGNLTIRKRFDELINGDGNFIFHNQVFNLNDYFTISEILRVKKDAYIENSEMDIFVSFLFSNGFFTFNDSLQSDWCTYIQIPNEQAKLSLIRHATMF
jgi:hypothetical protein